MTRHEIGAVSDFPEGRGSKVFIDGIRIAVFRIDGDVFAIHDVCSHKNLPLHLSGQQKYDGERGVNEGKVVGGVDEERRVVKCPWHHLEWDLETGACEAIHDRIPTYDVEVDDGRVFIEV